MHYFFVFPFEIKLIYIINSDYESAYKTLPNGHVRVGFFLLITQFLLTGRHFECCI